LSLSICGGEFEASRPVPSAFHFVLQFVKQPTKLRRVLLGAREFDRPIVRAAEDERWLGAITRRETLHFLQLAIRQEKAQKRSDIERLPESRPERPFR
jgi:hypothetical protein